MSPKLHLQQTGKSAIFAFVIDKPIPKEPCRNADFAYNCDNCDPEKCALATENPWCGAERRTVKLRKLHNSIAAIAQIATEDPNAAYDTILPICENCGQPMKPNSSSLCRDCYLELIGKPTLQRNWSYSEQRVCIDCQAPITNHATRCPRCAAIFRHKEAKEGRQ